MSDRRWRRVVLVRLAMAGLAAIGLVAMRGAAPSADTVPGLVVVVLVAYVLVVLAVEGVRHRRGSSGAGLITPLVLLDGTVLAVVLAASGGTSGPLEILIALHVVAMAVAVSARTGLEATVWHATLLLVVTTPEPSGGAAVHAVAYVVAGVAVATIAALGGRTSRRHREHLAAQVQLLARLEPAVTVEETCAALVAQMVLDGFGRGVVLVRGGDGVVGASAAGAHTPVLVAAPPSPERHGLLSISDDQESVLVRFLDPEADPLLDRLLPGAMNLVGVPILVDGVALGVAVGEWRPGARTRIPPGVVQGLRRDAGHCGLALRAVLLLEQVEQRSRRDLLTGLVNRRGFDEALDRELSRVERSRGSMSLTLIDLDHFKTVNDEQGHQVGDRVLAAIGPALVRAARTHDVVARIGGDEFALLLHDCDPEAARIVADRVLAAVATTVGHHGVTASAGVATAPRSGRTPGTLVRAADEALYAAKAAGRNRTVVSGPRPTVTDLVLVLDDAEERGRPLRRADLMSRVPVPAGRRV